MGGGTRGSDCYSRAATRADGRGGDGAMGVDIRARRRRRRACIAVFAVAMLAGAGMAPAAVGDGSVRPDASESEDIARAEALIDAGDGDGSTLDDARALLDGVLEANPGSAGAYREYARIHMVQTFLPDDRRDPEGLDKAGAALDRAIALAPEFAEARVLRGHLYTMLDRYPEAHAELDAAEALGGASGWLHINRGNLHRAQGDVQASLDHCRRVRPEGERMHTVRAADRCVLSALNALQRADEAEAVYLAALERDPGYPRNHGNYAWFLLCRAGRPQDAIEYARAALALEEYRDARETHDVALYAEWARQFRSGDADAEARAFARAVGEAPIDPASWMQHRCGGPATMDLMRALRDSGRMEGMPPMVAVLAAADAGNSGLPGIFGFIVAGTGSGDDGVVYLNSEEDYRDPRALTARMTGAAARAWRELHREDPQALKGRRITVVGYARRVRIDFTHAGLPTGKYYYQTHVDVREPWQIMIGLAPAPAPRTQGDRI